MPAPASSPPATATARSIGPARAAWSTTCSRPTRWKRMPSRRRREVLTLRIAREIASHPPPDSPAKAGVQGATDCAVALGPAFAGESGKGYADSRLRLTLCASRQTILLIPDTDEGCHDDRDQADAGP